MATTRPATARILAAAEANGWTVAVMHPTLQPDAYRLTRGNVEVRVYDRRNVEAGRSTAGNVDGAIVTGRNRAGRIIEWLEVHPVDVYPTADELAELRADGRRAHAAGELAAPWLSAVVRRLTPAGLPVGSRRFPAVCEAFTAGYEAARDDALAALLAEMEADAARTV